MNQFPFSDTSNRNQLWLIKAEKEFTKICYITHRVSRRVKELSVEAV
jgi:hypothetical protein